MLEYKECPKEVTFNISYKSGVGKTYTEAMTVDLRAGTGTIIGKQAGKTTEEHLLHISYTLQEMLQKQLSLKRNIAPVAKHYDSSPYYYISDADYADILSTIKHTGSTYEQTPASLKGHEEDLRNLLLASLNANYKGEVAGERFRHNGKTDICIERENRAAFVAECKMWTGAKEVEMAIDQLDGYLTWRDCKTALIYFAKRKEFLKTLETAEAALRAYNGMRSVRAVDKNEFDCAFSSKNNPGQIIKMRVMLFNLYCEDR